MAHNKISAGQKPPSYLTVSNTDHRVLAVKDYVVKDMNNLKS